MSAACRFGALRRFVAAGAAVALVPVAGAGLAVASAPAASAQGIGAECAAITEASAGWGIKESFRRYLKTIAIPDGGWDLDGVGFHGGETTADGAFDFHAKPAPESHIDGEDADIPLSGSIVLHGHANLLRIELTAMSVKVRGSEAQFVADFSSNTVNRPTAGAQLTGRETGTQVPIATFALDAPIDAGAVRTGSFSLSGVGTITEDGNRAFGGNYGPDNNTADRLDVHGTTVPGLCVGGELGELARTAPASGAAADTDTGGDTDTQGETAEQSGAPALDVAPAPQPSSGGAQQASAPRASTSATGYAAQSAPAASNGTCTADGALGVADARLGWGVKDSFRTYIRSSTAKGGWTTSGGAVYNSGAFVFSGSDGAVDTASGQGDLRYGGSVNFTGHGGVLDLTLADPEVQFSGGTGALIANVTSNDTEGARRDLGRITVADLAVSQNTSGDVVDGTASATLTAAGASAMSDFYPAGTEMAPVTFRASLAGTATCAEAAGTRASSAAVSGGSGASAANALKKGGSDLGAMPADETDAAKDDASAKRSATSLLGEEAADTTEVDDRSIALALASNAGVPVALALLIIAAGALGYVIARNRRTGGMTADAGADGKSAARPGHDEQ